VQELLGLGDVLVTAATPPSRAAMEATKTTPIVLSRSASRSRGLVKSMARPGGNITGLSLLTSELSGRRLKLLVDCVGKAQTVAVIKNPANRVHETFLAESRAAAGALGLQLAPLDAAGPDDIERAFDAARAMKADAAIVFDDPVLWSHRKRFVALAEKAKLPLMYGYREFVDEGGLISLGPDRVEHYRRTAVYVDRILKGANPAELPVEQPVKFQLVINVKSANARLKVSSVSARGGRGDKVSRTEDGPEARRPIVEKRPGRCAGRGRLRTAAGFPRYPAGPRPAARCYLGRDRAHFAYQENKEAPRACSARPGRRAHRAVREPDRAAVAFAAAAARPRTRAAAHRALALARGAGGDRHRADRRQGASSRGIAAQDGHHPNERPLAGAAFKNAPARPGSGRNICKETEPYMSIAVRSAANRGW
jgi:putative ABC transport system substrate-binding protein